MGALGGPGGDLGEVQGPWGATSAASASPPRRRRIQQAQLMKGPNKIILTMEDLTFINTQSSKQVRGGGARLGCLLWRPGWPRDLTAPEVTRKETLCPGVCAMVSLGLERRSMGWWDPMGDIFCVAGEYPWPGVLPYS